jgi:hypothetical protein
MPTIAVKDATGASVDIEKPSAPGRTAAAAARPVVLSAEDLAALVEISTKLNVVPTTLPRTGAATIMACQTAGDGATWAAFANQACTCLSLVNNSGQDLEFRRGGAGNALPLLNRMAYLVVGLTNANQVSIRRIDQSNTQVTLSAEALG